MAKITITFDTHEDEETEIRAAVEANKLALILYNVYKLLPPMDECEDVNSIEYKIWNEVFEEFNVWDYTC